MDDDSDRGGKEGEKEGSEGGEVMSSATGFSMAFLLRYGSLCYSLQWYVMLYCTVLFFANHAVRCYTMLC